MYIIMTVKLIVSYPYNDPLLMDYRPETGCTSFPYGPSSFSSHAQCAELCSIIGIVNDFSRRQSANKYCKCGVVVVLLTIGGIYKAGTTITT
jgi:hypothetical protein